MLSWPPCCCRIMLGPNFCRLCFNPSLLILPGFRNPLFWYSPSLLSILGTFFSLIWIPCIPCLLLVFPQLRQRLTWELQRWGLPSILSNVYLLLAIEIGSKISSLLWCIRWQRHLIPGKRRLPRKLSSCLLSLQALNRNFCVVSLLKSWDQCYRLQKLRPSRKEHATLLLNLLSLLPKLENAHLEWSGGFHSLWAASSPSL